MKTTKEVNKGFSLLTSLNSIIVQILLGIIYYIIFVPVGIFIRFLGKDLLKLKISSKINSYWIKRKKDLGSMNKQL